MRFKALVTSTFGIISILLNGCTQNFTNINDTLTTAILGPSDIQLTKAQIEATPYASSYVRINGGSQIVMVLALAETHPETGTLQLKWVSADKTMLITENGRIVKTLRLPEGNLTRLIVQTQPGKTTSWQGYYDWSAKQGYHIHAKGELIYQGVEVIETPLGRTNTTYWLEHVNFPQINSSLTNQYWIDTPGKIIKSIQFIGPNMTKIEMTIIKPFIERKQQ